jgi:hypothetical protein
MIYWQSLASIVGGAALLFIFAMYLIVRASVITRPRQRRRRHV